MGGIERGRWLSGAEERVGDASDIIPDLFIFLSESFWFCFGRLFIGYGQTPAKTVGFVPSLGSRMDMTRRRFMWVHPVRRAEGSCRLGVRSCRLGNG